MKILFTIFCHLLISNFSVFAQTGFFLVVDNKEHCIHLLKSVDYQQEFCVPEEPIIKSSEFNVEGKLEYDVLKENQFFNLRFSQTGFETLKLICQRLPLKQLVLVVNGKVAGTFDSKKMKPIQLMAINGKADSKEIKWVYETLRDKNMK